MTGTSMGYQVCLFTVDDDAQRPLKRSADPMTEGVIYVIPLFPTSAQPASTLPGSLFSYRFGLFHTRYHGQGRPDILRRVLYAPTFQSRLIPDASF